MRVGLSSRGAFPEQGDNRALLCLLPLGVNRFAETSWFCQLQYHYGYRRLAVQVQAHR